MKIIEKQNPVKIEGDVEVKKFGFLFNAKMVQLLSDSLYQDKILAIVRELSTNAYDSQVENGNADKPYEVHLPTYDEPYFSIRDYGTGMSSERIDLIYRHYGGSDRTESNDFTGGMGLGSKTPFCYHTRSFTVDSWYDGTHICYSCYIGEDGIPNIAKMSEAKSDEPSGVRIKLSVKSYDFRDFKHAAQKIYPYFPVTPKFSGEPISIGKPVYVLHGNDGDWKLRSSDNHGCRVIMGNVAYPVEFDDANITTAQRNVMRSCFDIFAEIGSLSVDIGREGLSYDNRTKTRIRYYINKIVSDFNMQIQQEVTKSKNLWEARKKFIELYNTTDVKVMDGSKIEYNGIKLFADCMHYTISMDKYTSAPRVGAVVPLQITSISAGYGSQKYEKQNCVNAIHINKKQVFYINDLNIGSFVRAAEIAKKDGVTVLLFKFNDPSIKQSVLDTIGCDESYFTNISTVPSPTVRGPRQKRGNISKVVKFNPEGHSCSYNFWTQEENIDMDKGGVYVEFHRFKYKDVRTGRFESPCEIQNYLMRNCTEVGINFPVVYGIKTADIVKVKKNKKWVELHDYLKDKVNAIINNYDIRLVKHYAGQFDKLFTTKYSYGHEDNNNRFLYNTLLRIRQYCTKDSAFVRFVDKVVRYKKIAESYNKVNAVDKLCYMLGIQLVQNSKESLEELDKEEAAVYNTYRLLGMLQREYSRDVNVRYIASYIDEFSN